MKDAQMLPQYAVALLFVVGVSVACVFAERRARDVQKSEAVAAYEKGWLDAVQSVNRSLDAVAAGSDFSDSMAKEFAVRRALFLMPK